ncbi:MAG TPA: hypothetical protein VKR22_02880 [Acidimicrobiales bacterium]|nr:hypothetical protein [Acidimicrobiales bacterium]
MHGRKRDRAARRAIGAGTVGVGAVVLALAGCAGVSAAASAGGYSQDQQDCQWNAEAWNTPNGATDPGCHNLAVNGEGGGNSNGDPNSSNTRYAEWGNDMAPNDPNSVGTPTIESVGIPGSTGSPHAGCVAANTDGTDGGTGPGCGDNAGGAGFEANYDYYQWYCPVVAAAGKPCEDDNPGTTTVTPDTGSATDLQPIITQGLIVYFGANDNLDNGEHDGVSGLNGTDGAVNGPSDGGALQLSITPQSALEAFSATKPEGLANFSEGECADGICSELTTDQQTVYYGCDGTNPQNNNAADTCTAGTPESGNVFENKAPASTQEPYNCSSGDATSENCAAQGGQSFNTYRSETPQQMNAEPGFQTYQDPDPQRSPAAPFGTPGAYAGTCGVYANDSGGAGAPGITGQDPGWMVNEPLGSCGG